MILAHKIELDPNNTQATYFAKACGTARFAYNWALEEWQRQYEAWKLDNSLPRPSEAALRRQLNAIKRDEFPWMMDVAKDAPQIAIMQLGDAFKNFWARRSKYPKFKKKGVRDSFHISNSKFTVEGSRIRIPKLGWVRMREPLRFTGRILRGTVSRVADRWFVSIAVDTEDKPQKPAENQGMAGVDLGISAFATLHDGEKMAGPKPYKALLTKLKTVSRALSRKQGGSANYQKAKVKFARLHRRIANIRRDAVHKLTADLTRRFHTTVVEDLDVQGMLKNRSLSLAISDMAFYEFRRQVTYKAEWRGGQIIVADRWFASSKICSSCGVKQDKMPLSVREWTFPDCGEKRDRDVNAAKNLLAYGVAALNSPTAGFVEGHACGEKSSGSRFRPKAKLVSVKQEVSTNSKLIGTGSVCRDSHLKSGI